MYFYEHLVGVLQFWRTRSGTCRNMNIPSGKLSEDGWDLAIKFDWLTTATHPIQRRFQALLIAGSFKLECECEG